MESLLARFHQKDRSALAQAITIIESTAEHDKSLVRELLAKLCEKQSKSIRVAISGPPGVGKSTFINTLGQKIIERGFFLGVLPIDPSSEYSRGSILGDKIRMKDLLASNRVFIRPSPSKGVLGGMSLTTPDTMSIMEAFGCDFVIIETVGVGQSEALAHSLGDHFVLLLQPGLGDAVQLMKKGVMESADFILVNKRDEYEGLAEKARTALFGFKNSSHQIPAQVSVISALKDQGVDDFLKELLKRHAVLETSGALVIARKARREKLFYYCFEQKLCHRLKDLALTKHGLLESLTRAEHNGLLPEVDDIVENIVKRL